MWNMNFTIILIKPFSFKTLILSHIKSFSVFSCIRLLAFILSPSKLPHISQCLSGVKEKSKVGYNFTRINIEYAYISAKSLLLCPNLCNLMNHSLPGSSVHGILRARILEWVAISFSRRSSQARDRIHAAYISRWNLYTEAPGKLIHQLVFVVQSLSRLLPHGLQHARLPCPLLSPRVYSNSCLLNQWCYLTISFSATVLSFSLRSFLASGSFPISWLFALGGQN